MIIKRFTMFSTFLTVTSLSIALFLLCAGCGIFGGGKKADESPVVQEPMEESSFESDKMDVEIKPIAAVDGSLNWSKGFVQAKGFGVFPPDSVNEDQGRLLALKSAYADAMANLLAITGGVRVTANTTVKDYITEDYTVQLTIDGIIKGARELSKEYNAERKTAVIQLGIYLEDVAKAIPKEDLPSAGEVKFYEWDFKEDATLYKIVGEDKALKGSIENSKTLDEIKKSLKQMAGESATRDEALLAKIESMDQEIDKLKGLGRKLDDLSDATGVVIVAAGMGIEESMLPSIYYRDGDKLELLYGNDDGREKARDSLAYFCQTVTEAFGNRLVKDNPYSTVAVGLTTDKNSVVINSDDAKLIEKINKANSILENCKVVIVK